MEKPYLDTNGKLQPRNAWDMHHVIPRCKANTSGQKHFINQEGLVLPLFRIWHNLGSTALHSNVPHPHMPDKRLAREITHTLIESQGENIYDRFIDMAGVVMDIAETTSDVGFGRDAKLLSRNLQRQMPFILNGMVREASEASHD